MKKIIILVVTLLFCLFFVTGCGSNKLIQIVDKFNSKGDLVAFANYGIIIEATTNKKDKINITMESKKLSKIDLEYTIKDNVISGKFVTNSNNSFFVALATYYLIDSISQLNGHESNAVLPSITDAKIEEYTLEKEGLYLIQGGNYLEIKMDINKKIPLVDFSDVYLEVDNILYGKEKMQNGEFSTQRGNIKMNVRTQDGISVITIGEKDKITNNSYNTLLSIVKVLFDKDKAVDLIKSKYSGIEEGNKSFNGVNIELDYALKTNELTDFELAGLKIMRVTIKHKEFKKSIK